MKLNCNGNNVAKLNEIAIVSTFNNHSNIKYDYMKTCMNINWWWYDSRSGMHIIISNADKALILIQMYDKFLTQINGKKRIMAIAILVVLKNRYGLRNEYLKWVPRKSVYC